MITQVLGPGCVTQDNIFGWESVQPSPRRMPLCLLHYRNLIEKADREYIQICNELEDCTEPIERSKKNHLLSKALDACRDAESTFARKNREFYLHADILAQDGVNAETA